MYSFPTKRNPLKKIREYVDVKKAHKYCKPTPTCLKGVCQQNIYF